MTELAAPSTPPAMRAHATINGRDVLVEWTARADEAMQARPLPLVLELELYFSCLVKKFVHFRDTAGPRPVSWVNDRLAIYFRPVASTACSWETAQRLGRQPEAEIDTPALRRVAPKRVRIDYRRGSWIGEYWL